MFEAARQLLLAIERVLREVSRGEYLDWIPIGEFELHE